MDSNGKNLFRRKRCPRVLLYGVVCFLLLVTLLVGGCRKTKVHKVGILCGLEYISAIADGFKENV